MKKSELRKQIDQGMAAFLANPEKKITKCPTGAKKREPKLVQEETVEIDVHHLPLALQKKFFAE